VNKDQFRYPGPLPYSKETAILMMADTVEAASKSLKNPSGDSIDSLIDALIKSKMEDDQFINSNITFKEINQIKRKTRKERSMNTARLKEAAEKIVPRKYLRVGGMYFLRF